MGAGASAQEVRSKVEGLGSAYAVYGPALVENGVDGALCAELATEPTESVTATFADLGVTSALHRRKLLQAMRSASGLEATPRRSGSLDSTPAVAVVEVDEPRSMPIVPSRIDASGGGGGGGGGAGSPAVATPMNGAAAFSEHLSRVASSGGRRASAPRSPAAVAVQVDGGGAGRAPSSASPWTVHLAWEGDVDLDLAAAVFGERQRPTPVTMLERGSRGKTLSKDREGGALGSARRRSARRRRQLLERSYCRRAGHLPGSRLLRESGIRRPRARPQRRRQGHVR